MMNTGRFIWRAQAVESNLAEEVEQRRMVSQLMSDAGYETFVSGKWHVKIDADKIFDHVEHIRPGMPADTPSSYQRPNDKGDWTAWDEKLGGFWEGGKHWSEVLAEDGAAFLKTAASSDRPFYMYLAFNAPHDPRQSPKSFVDLYDRDEILIPVNFMPENPFMEAMGAGKSLRDEKLAPWPRTHAAVQLHRQEYYALISHLDEQIGKILAALEETGQADNTYIVMTADHGLACGQHGLLGKQSMYEHSMKAPLMVVGPGIPAGKRIDTPVYVQDFTATALEWAGVKQPEHVEFKSLLPLIRGERDSQYDLIYGAYESNKQRMVRKDNWKLIHYPGVDQYLLFNLQADPAETHDLAADPSLEQKLAELKVDLHTIMDRMGDPMLAEVPPSPKPTSPVPVSPK
jgi:arylsulfatase A-like enzyme